MWFYREDRTRPVFTSADQVQSELDETGPLSLPETAILLYMNGEEFIHEHYVTETIMSHFPRFLRPCPITRIRGKTDICFLDGGRGAPMAADTLETLHALGVKNAISVGMIGAFVKQMQIGDIVIPDRAYVEEGTSLHYYESIAYSQPDPVLFEKLVKQMPAAHIASIVSTDAVYRQTFYKEALWRAQGCVGVDMETSALLSVGQYCKMHVASVLMVSDKHPLSETEAPWEWHMTPELRQKMLSYVIDFALSLSR